MVSKNLGFLNPVLSAVFSIFNYNNTNHGTMSTIAENPISKYCLALNIEGQE